MKKYLLLVYLVAISCQQTITTNNSENDVKIAKEITSVLYKDLIKLDTLNIYKYLDSSISKKELSESLNEKFKDFGNIESFEILSTETKSTVIDDYSQTNYRVTALVFYEKSHFIEKISFKKIDNNISKLDGYSYEQVLK